MQKCWFGNLEGTLQKNCYKSNIFGVYNDFEGIKELLKQFNYVGFALANNHIFDKGSYSEIKKPIEQLNVKFCGVGNDLIQACQPLVLYECNTEIVILNLGWEVFNVLLQKNTKKGLLH